MKCANSTSRIATDSASVSATIPRARPLGLLSADCSATPSEILRAIRSKQKPGDPRENNAVNHQSFERRKRTDSNVECHPGQCQPARPVMPPKHERTCNECQQLSEFNPKILGMKRPQIRKMVHKRNSANRNKQPRYSCDRQRPLVLVHGSISITSSLGSSFSACGGQVAPASSMARIAPT